MPRPDTEAEYPPPKEQSEADKARAEKLITEAQKRFKLCEEAERDLRTLALDDLRFRAGDQWPETIKQQRIQDRKVCLTINVLPARERQILNEQRQNRPAIKISPVDDKADPDTADVIEGLIRHIEYDSDADVAYDTGSACAVRMGFGYMRPITEFVDGDSGPQCIKIKRVRNPFQIYLDPSAQEADRSDANFGFVFETFTNEEYKDAYPDSELAGLTEWKGVGQSDPSWLSEDSVRICEYFTREKDGKIHWYKFNAIEILEETIWPGKWIPIVPILGDELDVDGKLILEGMVRHAKDPLRMQNVMASEEVQAIGLAPKAPFIAAAGQIEGHPEWQTANTNNYSVLVYEPVDVGGHPVPAPQRQVAEPPIQAITIARGQFADDLRQVTGIHEAQYGAPSNEKTGKAIQLRKMQGEISNFHYLDNLTRAIRYLGRQLVDLIPKIYSQAQMIRIIGEDKTQKVVQVNKEFQLPSGQAKKYDLTIGKYDVTVSSGPSFQTRRQESTESMLEFLKVFPQAAPVTGDLVAGMMDWPQHEKFAARLKKLLPPGVADDDPNDPESQVQNLQAKLQQMTQQHELLTQALNKEIQIRETKQVEVQGRGDVEKFKAQKDFELKRIELETRLAIAEIQTKAQDALQRAKLDHDLAMKLHVSASEQAGKVQDHAHDLEMQQREQQAAAESQASEQAHEAEQGDLTRQATAEQTDKTLQAQQAQSAESSQ